jgi:hypothetical protein
VVRACPAGVFPVLAVYLPFDACASILDGSLLGAGKLRTVCMFRLDHSTDAQVLVPSSASVAHSATRSVLCAGDTGYLGKTMLVTGTISFAALHLVGRAGHLSALILLSCGTLAMLCLSRLLSWCRRVLIRSTLSAHVLLMLCISHPHNLALTLTSYAADLLTVWLSIKILTLGRVLFGAARVFGEHSPLSAKQGSRDDAD